MTSMIVRAKWTKVVRCPSEFTRWEMDPLTLLSVVLIKRYSVSLFLTKLQFVPLQPKQLGLHKFPLLRCIDRSDTYRSYIACKDGIFQDREDTTSPSFPTFELSTTYLYKRKAQHLARNAQRSTLSPKFLVIRNYGEDVMHGYAACCTSSD